MVYTIEEQIKDVSHDRPHVVILGAGASLQALPNGDKNGRTLPLMNNLVEILQLEEILNDYDINYRGQNFEELYDSISLDSEKVELRKVLEFEIHKYFSKLELPDEPTLYDYLVLSLRPKDMIATFNWDPFLTQALVRNQEIGGIPRIAFLHGCVAIGYCSEHNRHGLIDSHCQVCKKDYLPTKLLYPIRDKEYAKDQYFLGQWEMIKWGLMNAFLLTIFGYSAPRSDVKAMGLFTNAWGDASDRRMEQIEIIDIKSKDELHMTWKELIFSHHWGNSKDFFSSMLIQHPRRSVEAYWQQFYMAEARQQNYPPQTASWNALWDWYGDLVRYEKK